MGESTHSIPIDVLNDLCSRFITNLPDSHRNDPIRLCFHIELAYWFYLDFKVEEHNLKRCTIREFMLHVFQRVSYLQGYIPNIKEVYNEWMDYKRAVPTYGAILLDPSLSKVVLVRAKSSGQWMFPRGKVNEDEPPHCCAVREVYEETGFDVSKMIKEDVYFENVLHEQLNRLYIVTGVQLGTKFKTMTRNEITDVRWHNVTDLPPCKIEAHTGKIKEMVLVRPFVKQIRKWIDMQRKNQPEKRARHKSQGDLETVKKADASRRTKSQHQAPEMVDLNDLAVRQMAQSPHKNKKEHRSRSRNKSGGDNPSASKMYVNGNKSRAEQNGNKQQQNNNAKQGSNTKQRTDGKQRSEGGNGKQRSNGKQRTESCSEKQPQEIVNGKQASEKQRGKNSKTPTFWSKEWDTFTIDREAIYKIIDECLAKT